MKEKNKNTKTPQKSKSEKDKRRKPSFMDNFFKPKPSPFSKKQTATNSMSTSPDIANNGEVSWYYKIFKPPKHDEIAPIHCSKQNIIQITENQKIIARKNVPYPQPTAIPMVFVDEMEKNEMIQRQQQSIGLTKEIEAMQIDHDQENDKEEKIEHDNHKKIKLQWKYRFFSEDNRPAFFGVNKYERMHALKCRNINIKKLCRSPFASMVNEVNYDGDDSGIEWYEDIDDLENCEDLDDESEEEIDGTCLRSDGFENDAFLINSDDDDQDKDIMGDIEKYKQLKNRTKNEYPIKFIQHRRRGDTFDKPIVIQLPSIKNRTTKNDLYQLTIKKAKNQQNEVYGMKHHEKENDAEYLLKIENKESDKNKKEEEERKKKKKEKKEKKKKKKEKKDKEKKEKEKNDKMEMDEKEKEKVKNGKMEMDEDEDDDIKMKNKNIDSPPKQNNTLKNYFKKQTKKEEKEEHVDDKNKNKKEEIQEKPKKKKPRRVVMCELIE